MAAIIDDDYKKQENNEGALEARIAQKFFREGVECCMEKDLAKFKTIVDNYAESHESVTFRDLFEGFQTEGKTLLHIAASQGCTDIITYILNSCGDISDIINKCDQKGFSPVLYATISEDMDALKYLISKGGNVNLADCDNAACIHFAAGDGSVERMKVLVEAGANVEASSHAGTPLHWAAGKGNVEAVKYLISLKVDVNHTNDTHLPAVFLAAVSGSDACTAALAELEHIDLGAILSDNLTIMHICAENGLIEAIKKILTHETGRKCVNVFSADNLLPIHLAAISNYDKIVEILKPLSTADEKVCKEWTVSEILSHGGEWLAQWEKRHGSVADSEKEASESAKPVANYPEAEPIDPPASEEAEKEAAVFKEKGNAAFLEKDYQLAIQYYTEAIKLHGNNYTLWSNRSACYMFIKEYQLSLRDAEICRSINPTWVKGCFRLASARLALDMYEDAAVAAFEGCKLDDKNKEMKALLVKAVQLGQEAHKKQHAAEASAVQEVI